MKEPWLKFLDVWLPKIKARMIAVNDPSSKVSAKVEVEEIED